MSLKEFEGVDIRTCFKPNQTLRQLLVHPKDKIPLSDKTRIVYQVDCSSCGRSYVGQTGRDTPAQSERASKGTYFVHSLYDMKIA